MGGQGSGLGPRPACVLRACPLQSRRDNKTNNFLDLLSWTPFIFPQPQGRTDLVVGPERGSCTVTGGWATPAPLLPASCLPPCSPLSLLLAEPAAAPFIRAPLALEPFSLLSGSHPSPFCFCVSLCLPPPHHLRPSFCFRPWTTALCPLSPPLPGPPLAASLGPPSLSASPTPDVWLCWATQLVLFPRICCPVAAREGAAGRPGQEGGALPGSPRSSRWPLQAGRGQGGQTLVWTICPHPETGGRSSGGTAARARGGLLTPEAAGPLVSSA